MRKKNGARGTPPAATASTVSIVWCALAIAGAAGCDPATPQVDTGGADAAVDRIILMAGSGGGACPGLPGAGGATPLPSPGDDGPVASGGLAGGPTGAGSGGHGDVAASASGGHAGRAGANGAAGRGGAGAMSSGGVAGVGGRVSPGGVAGTGGVGGSGGAAATNSGASGGGAGAGGRSGGGATGGMAGVSGIGGVSGDGGTRAAGGAGGEDGAGGAAVPTRSPVAGDLAIVELLINPAGTDTGREWIEVVNRADHAVDLADLHVADAANDAAVDFTVSGTTILLAGGRAVLIQSAEASKNGGVPLGVTSGTFGGSFGTRVSLNNDGDDVSVCAGPCAGGVVIAQFAWDATLGADYDDHALSIDDGGRRCPAPTPFGDAGSFGTPGVPNPSCPP